MLSCLAWPAFSPARSAQTWVASRYPLLMDEPHEDSWESLGWEAAWAQQDDLGRDQVQQLARRLAAQRERQRTEDLVQLEDMKRALRERAADVARRELEVERRTRELEEPEAPRRTLRFRRAEKPAVDEDRAYAEELISRREAEVDERAQAVETRERELAQRETALLGRQLELEEAEPALAERERRVAELEPKLEGLDAREQDIAQRAGVLEGAERALARETVAPATGHVSFSEGLEALTGWRPRRD